MRGLAWWVTLTLLWLLLVHKVTLPDAVAAAVFGALSAAMGASAIGRARRRFAPRLAWLPVAGRLPAGVLRDSWLLVVALWRRLVRGEDMTGQFVAVPFDPGSDDPESAARRALVVAGSSLTPNTCAITVDRAGGRLLLHQLVPTPEPPGKGDREWPL